MKEANDFLGKKINKNDRLIYIDKDSMSRGVVIGINRDGFLKVENEITKKFEIIKDTINKTYAYPEVFDMTKVFEDFEFEDIKENKIEKRKFKRDLSEVLDISNENILSGDKVLVLHNGNLSIGRVTEIDDKRLIAKVAIREEKYPVEIKSKCLYLLVKDYFIKSKE